MEPKTAIVNSKELGTNCWSSFRFIKSMKSMRCPRVYVCTYPEKKACQAVYAEIAHLKQEQVHLMNQIIQIDHTVEMLTDMLEK